ncbi:SH3 domain-containing protein [Reichenbachiella agariperforans]|uniref:SH3 domain-containing protein n=1 Tax=Reichenbachiella agariperforans TaxID=156994 RepID=A0A1M6LKM8_REIAG|nr:SH3 domain-containing protein [Reichenbachiella agariperforans]
MTKKQNILSNFIIIVFAIFITHSLTAQESQLRVQLSHADSLFKEGKYTESFEVYNQLLQKEGHATPQMLMKMAYIKEGLGNHSEALLYLNKYYLMTSNKNARNKMAELAEEENLEGYKVTDYDFFKGLLNSHFLWVNIVVISIAFLLFAIVVYRRFWTKTNALPYAISMCVVLLLLFFVSNYELDIRQVIIADDYVYLMDGPSVGSDLVEVIQKGHRLTILDEDEVWVKVAWKDQEAYVKQSKVLKVI